MVAQLITSPELDPAEVAETLFSRLDNGEDLDRSDVLRLSRALMTIHGRRFPRQGGYTAKKELEHVAKDNMPNTYDPALKLPPTSAQLDRMQSGVRFEEEIGQRLAGIPGVVVIDEVVDADGNRTEDGKRAKEEATFAAYTDPSVRMVFNARMGGRFSELVSEFLGFPVDDEYRVSEPDAIDFGRMMPNGLRAMRFIDVKWHKVTTGKSEPKPLEISELDDPFYGSGFFEGFQGQLQKVDWMQLSHYYRHGASLHVVDQADSYIGGVIGKEEKVVWAPLNEERYMYYHASEDRRMRTSVLDIYDVAFADSVEIIENAIARDIDPRVPNLTFSEWTGECKEGPWRDVCLRELQENYEGGHITLLPGVTSMNRDKFYAAGILSTADLARRDYGDEIKGLKDTDKYIAQARVEMSGRVAIVDYFPDEPTNGQVTLDLAGIEVDFDYEADHVLYQRGVLVTDRTGMLPQELVGVHTFDDFTGTDEGEAQVFVDWWALMKRLEEEAAFLGKTIAFYHYSHYERTQDKRLVEKHAGVPGIPTLGELLDWYTDRNGRGPSNVVDLYEVCKKQLVWPTKSHSIKDLAKHVGFSWRGEGDQNGAESMVWYRSAVNDEDEAVREKFIAMLRTYNTDDVTAQLVLREFIVDGCVNGTFPRAQRLEAPAPA